VPVFLKEDNTLPNREYDKTIITATDNAIEILKKRFFPAG